MWLHTLMTTISVFHVKDVQAVRELPQSAKAVHRASFCLFTTTIANQRVLQMLLFNKVMYACHVTRGAQLVQAR